MFLRRQGGSFWSPWLVLLAQRRPLFPPCVCKRPHPESAIFGLHPIHQRATRLFPGRRKETRRPDVNTLEKRQVSTVGLHMCRHVCVKLPGQHVRDVRRRGSQKREGK